MKRSILSPLLFITAIVLDRVVISSAQIELSQSLRALVILLSSASLAMLIVQYFIRDWHHTQFIVLMVPLALITYRSSYSFLKTSFPFQATNLGIGLMLILGLLYAILVRRSVWKFVGNPAQVTAYFNLVFLVLLLFQLVRLGRGGFDGFMNPNHPQASFVPAAGADLKLKKGSSPDIYVIVLDGYARQDVLQAIYGEDNSEFIDGLEKRGFYVASDSHSNYSMTAYAMASFWNFEHIQPWDSIPEYEQHLFQPIQHNSVFHSLDQLGYTTVSFEGELSYTQIKNSEVYLSDFLPLNNFETLMLVDSPLEPLSNLFDLGLPLHTYRAHRQRTLFQLETLKEIPTKIPGPKIVYAHILAPHPPFVFSQDGTSREPDRPYTLGDDINYENGREEYWIGYVEQVRFISGEITTVIDAILAKSETPPVIVLMSDHGPASMFNWNFETPECLWERASNLYAILLPGHENDNTLYPSITPVNTFPVIFNTYFGTNLAFLEDRSYMMAWQSPKLKLDITNRRESREGCTIPGEEQLVENAGVLIK
jgi:hypothetical protein